MKDSPGPTHFNDLEDYLDAMLAVVTEHDEEKARRKVLTFFQHYEGRLPLETQKFLIDFFRARYGVDLGPRA